MVKEFDYKGYVKKFRAKSTAWHVKHYHEHNADFRKIARDELKKRRVPKSKLPYKSRKRTSSKKMTWF